MPPSEPSASSDVQTAELLRVRRKLEKSIRRGLAETRINMAVMGPSTDEDSPAAILRTFIARSANAYGATIKPEHRDFVHTAESTLGRGHNLALYELELVDICHLVVLIPASAGSLCELGLFAAADDAHKFLILVSSEFPSDGSFVADGPIKMAASANASVHFVDYSDHLGVWQHVRERIEEVRGQLRTKQLMGGGK